MFDIRRKPLFWWIAFAGWFVTLHIISSIPGMSRDAPIFMVSDKLLHLLYFFCGGVVLGIALRMRWQPRTRYFHSLIWVIVVASGAVIGAFDEWHQSFVPNRSGNSIGDWIADICGSVLACALLPLIWRSLRIQRARSPEPIG